MSSDSEPLALLRDIYARRQDLKEAYPEAQNGDLQALINWACGVLSNKIQDSEALTLRRYESWYLKHQKPLIRPVPVNLMQSAFKYTDKAMNFTFEHMLKDTDICEHLAMLYMISVEFNLKNALELGVGTGESTVALLEAAAKIGGHVWSIDVDPCLEAKKKIAKYELDKYWTFIQGDDKEIALSWNQEIHHLFIDTFHTYRQAYAELKSYEPHVVRNGFISLHDTRTYPEVFRAVRDFVSNKSKKFRLYNFLHCNGLTVMRKL